MQCTLYLLLDSFYCDQDITIAIFEILQIFRLLATVEKSGILPAMPGHLQGDSFKKVPSAEKLI